MVLPIRLCAAHCGAPLLLMGLLMAGLPLTASADTPAQRQDIAAAARQLDALERLVAHSAANTTVTPGERYHFDYVRLRADLARVRAGLQDFLAPPTCPAQRSRRACRSVPHRASRRSIARCRAQAMNGAQLSAFQANSGFTPAVMATVLVGAVFAVLLLWGAWAIRTAYVGWAESRINQRQFLGVVVRFLAMYVVMTFFLLS